MKRTFVRYGNEKRYFDPPPDWKILTFAVFEDHPGKRDAVQITRKALNDPIRSAPLQERISPSHRVAIIMEDQTRASPKKTILRTLLEELDRSGIPRENVSVIVALGTHKGLDSAGLSAVYGKEAVENYTFINHDCHAPDLVPVAKLKTGAVVKINKAVHEATFKIGIGSIFPHPLNGFGGGGKILFPGVADFAAILEHHLKYCFRGGSELGELEGNPFYDEVTEIAKAAGLDFIINSVLDHNDRLYDLVCGDPIEAHRAGIDICRGIISRDFQKKADLTVISAFPYTEGVQIMKPLAPATLITRRGGTVILVARCTAPIPDVYVEGCERFCRKYRDRLREGVFELFDGNRRIIEEGAPELNMSMAQALLGQNDFRVILVSEDIPREIAQRLGFLYAGDLDEAISMGAGFHSSPEVHIVPAGGVILPILE